MTVINPGSAIITSRSQSMKTSHLISFQSLNLGGRRGTTDNVATIPFHPSLSSVALRKSPNSIPVHSSMLSSHLFFCLPLLLLSLSPAEVSSPCQRILRCDHTSEFLFLYHGWRSSCTSIAFWILLRTSSFVTWSL